MSDLTYMCPQCRSALLAVRKGDFDTWECKSDHGVGLTLTEAHGHFQEDEIQAIWMAAKNAPQSSLQSPLLGHPMVAVTIIVDDDEIVGNEGPGAHPVTLDVAKDEQFLWFHVADAHAMPADLPNPPPTAEQRARMENLREQSARAIARDAKASEDPMSAFSLRFGTKAAALLHLEGFMQKLSERAKKRL